MMQQLRPYQLDLSLPTRERGLKYEKYIGGGTEPTSLPTRERGLKYGLYIELKTPKGSLPTRERGLKYGGAHDDKTLSEVAPYTGAWIEIPLYQIGTLR